MMEEISAMCHHRYVLFFNSAYGDTLDVEE